MVYSLVHSESWSVPSVFGPINIETVARGFPAFCVVGKDFAGDPNQEQRKGFQVVMREQQCCQDRCGEGEADAIRQTVSHFCPGCGGRMGR